MTSKEILEKVDSPEAVKSFVVPVKLTLKQKAQAANQLREARQKSRNEATDMDLLTANLLQLRFQIEDYLNHDVFKEDRRFGDFLKNYLEVLNRKNTEFAKEIDIHETLLSQLLNGHRKPSDNIFIRLEIHSNQFIAAALWFRLVEKERMNILLTNKQLRKEERTHVSNKISLRA